MLLWLLKLFLLHVIIIISAVFYHKSNALELKVDSYVQIKFFTSKRIYVLFPYFLFGIVYGRNVFTNRLKQIRIRLLSSQAQNKREISVFPAKNQTSDLLDKAEMSCVLEEFLLLFLFLDFFAPLSCFN